MHHSRRACDHLLVVQGIMYGKPVHQGISQLKPTKNLRSLAEERVGRACGGLRVLNSYWINQDSTYKYYEVVMVDPAHTCIKKVGFLAWLCDANKFYAFTFRNYAISAVCKDI